MLLWIALGLLLIWWWIRYQRIPDKFPRGPYGLPVIGYWQIFTAENVLVGLEKLHERFGPILSLNLGPGRRMVVIGDYETLKVRFIFY